MDYDFKQLAEIYGIRCVVLDGIYYGRKVLRPIDENCETAYFSVPEDELIKYLI